MSVLPERKAKEQKCWKRLDKEGEVKAIAG